VKIIVKYGDIELRSGDLNGNVVEKSNTFHDNLDNLSTFRMTLDDGGYAVFGEEVIKRSVFIFKD